ncbi:MAG: dipeptide epimerase [Anaerolineae bacterium]|nr:dipeptide epimerase [Anaerolineae bacterium]
MTHSLTTEPITLTLKTPFKIAHGTSATRHNVIVHLGAALGEAALAPYYGVTAADVIAYIESPQVAAALGDDLMQREDILDRLPAGPSAARAAIDMALHDRAARQMGVPLYRLWGLNPARAPLSSFTIGMEEDEAVLREKIREAAGFPILKLKLGSGSLDADVATVRIAREETDARLCVDANAGWTPQETAKMVERLAPYDLLFIEQPIAQDDLAGWHDLHRLIPGDAPPLIADESVHNSRDIFPLAGAVDGINIKLAKAGGLREAWRMIQVARGFGIKVMLGCMVESAVGVTAAAHLAPLVDYADLDGNLLVADDPFKGARLGRDGRIGLPEGPGLGVTRA